MKRLLILTAMTLIAVGHAGCSNRLFNRSAKCDSCCDSCGGDGYISSPSLGAPILSPGSSVISSPGSTAIPGPY